jgi:hypothetical protein
MPRTFAYLRVSTTGQTTDNQQPTAGNRGSWLQSRACEAHVNTIEGFWSLLRSWLRPHRGIPQDKLPLYLGFFQFVHNARRRGKALLGTLVAAMVL